MRILITGATGFMGSHVVPALSPQHELVCLVRHKGQIQARRNTTLVHKDLAQTDDLRALPDHVDAIIHLAQANVPFPDEANQLFAVNAASTQWLADYARRAGASHFIYASSGNVYAPSAEILREDSPCEPQGLYALTKHVSERILSCYNQYFSVSILRFFVPYGPGQTGRMIPGIISRVREGRTVVLTNGGEPRTNPIYISDVVKVLVQSLTLAGYHIVNVAGPETVSIQDIAKLAGAALGCEPVFEHRSVPEHRNLVASTARLESILDLGRRVSPAEGIRHMVQALKGRE